MGETQTTVFQPDFNRPVHVKARPHRLSADGGALLGRAGNCCAGWGSSTGWTSGSWTRGRRPGSSTRSRN